MTWFLAFVAFAALVVLHEYGHFIAAKAVGMKATRFSLFFPPALFKYKPKNSETSYEIGAIPAGGFVKIVGMNPEEEIPPEDLPRAYYMMPVWKRIVVISAGPAVNFLIAFILIWVLFAFVGVSKTGPATNKVGEVAIGQPATGVLKPGDKLVSVNGVEGTPKNLIAELQKSKCAGTNEEGCAATKPVTIVYERKGVENTVKLTPKYDSDAERMRIGMTFDTIKGPQETLPIGQAFTTTADRIWYVTSLTVTLPKRLFVERQRKEISSVAGGYERTQNAIKSSTEEAIGLIALISLSLAIINLFPFLPLDGGHIFWALAEKVRGKRIPTPVLERASIIGLALVGMLFIIGLSNDIQRFTNGTFGP
ncbi:MAG: site-2 protease family protein [Thermoleophilaceae bacterium]|nr:site-2 protease family protein [Thermoleophilaceae bacterium]